MSLKNPFGMRNGKMLMISDLSQSERGAKCDCACPNCGGELLARMGEKKIYHFAHTKDACDETIAFINGMLHITKQFVETIGKFYAPALAVKYHFPPPSIGMTMETVGRYVQIVPNEPNEETSGRRIIIAKSKTFTVGNVTLANNKNHQAEAILVCAKGRKLAIRIQPPPSVCKDTVISAYADLPTLIFDATDIDFYSVTSEKMTNELLDASRWVWLSNKKEEEVYSRVFGEYQEWAAKEFEKEERWCKERAELLRKKEEQRRIQKESLRAKQEQQRKEQEQLSQEQTARADEWNKARALYPGDIKSATEYFRVVRLFNQQDTPILDAYDNRWVKCELCGEVKRDYDFAHYGGAGRVNAGKCSQCARKGL